MLEGNEGPEMVCARCMKHFWPRVGAYWFLLLTQRGRCRFPHMTEARSVLCLECGRVLREWLEASAFTVEAAYDNAGKNWKGEKYGTERAGKAVSDGVPGGNRSKRRRAVGDGGLVRAHWTGPAP